MILSPYEDLTGKIMVDGKGIVKGGGNDQCDLTS